MKKKQNTRTTASKLKLPGPIPSFAMICSFAFIIRLIHLLIIKDNPFFNSPVIDAYTYTLWAKEILASGPIGKVVYFQPPLYPYIMAFFFKLFNNSIFALTFIQIIIGSLNCALIYLLGSKIISRRTGFVAGIISSLYAPFIFFDAELLPPVFLLFILLLFFIILAYRDMKHPVNLVIAGLLLGLGSLTMANVLIFFPGFILIYIFLNRKALSIPKLVLNMGLFLAVGIITIAPVTIRNYNVSGDFVLISSNAGINFFIGNNENFDETIKIRPGYHWDKLMQEPESQGILSPPKKSQYFMNKSREYIKNHPFHFLFISLKKTWHFVSGFERLRNQNIYNFRHYSPVLRVLLQRRIIAFPFGILFPFALAGIFLLRKQYKKLLYWYGFIVLFSISVIMFFVTARYRLPVIPFLIIMASVPIARYKEFFTRANSKYLKHYAIGLLILLIGCNVGKPGIDDMSQDDYYYNLGLAHMRSNQPKLALENFKTAVDLNPNHVSAINYGAKILYSFNKPDVAETVYLRSMEINPDYTETHMGLGMLYDSLQQYELAIMEYKDVITLNYYHPLAHYSLGLVYLQLQEYDRALAEFTIDTTFHESADSFNNIGLIFYTWKQYQEATKNFKKATELSPGYIQARNNLMLTASILKDWQTVYNEAEYILSVDPRNQSASQLMDEAIREIKK